MKVTEPADRFALLVAIERSCAKPLPATFADGADVGVRVVVPEHVVSKERVPPSPLVLWTSGVLVRSTEGSEGVRTGVASGVMMEALVVGKLLSDGRSDPHASPLLRVGVANLHGGLRDPDVRQLAVLTRRRDVHGSVQTDVARDGDDAPDDCRVEGR